MSLELKRTTPISVVEEIKRVDSVASTVFSVCMGIAAAAVGLVFAVEVATVQIAAAVVGFLAGFAALIVVPDVVFGQREGDLEESSLQRYLKRRRRNTQGVILLLLGFVVAGVDVGMAFFFADLADDPWVGVATGLAGVLGGLPGVLSRSGRDDLWPPEIRGRP